jgi:hypothetical protein
MLKAVSVAVAVLAATAPHSLRAQDALPRGVGFTTQGMFLFKHQCSRCHSLNDTYAAAESTGHCFVDPVRMFHYVKKTMPPEAAGTLKDTEVYALVAYVWEVKGILKRGSFLNAQALPQVVIPTNGVISSGCPKEAGGLGKFTVKASDPKTVPALLPASAVAAAPSPAKPRATR